MNLPTSITGLRGVSARRSAPQASVSRKDFTDRLGLPADATDAQVLATVDRARASKSTNRVSAAAREKAEADAIYERMYGAKEPESPTSNLTPEQAALYRKAWG